MSDVYRISFELELDRERLTFLIADIETRVLAQGGEMSQVVGVEPLEAMTPVPSRPLRTARRPRLEVVE